MVMTLLNLKEELPSDAADAAAVAIGHLLATRGLPKAPGRA
jgi:Holliday junction resolvasome RuvABC endonuclease subunit